jgi:hypothetical protein
MTEPLDVDVAATDGWDEDRRVDPLRHLHKSFEHFPAERNRPDRPVRLPALFQQTPGVAAVDPEDAVLAVDVGAMQPEELFRPETASDCEDWNDPQPRR